MKKILIIGLMLAGFVNLAMADTQSAVREALVSEQAPHFQEVHVNDVPEVVMNAFDAAYQNIGIEKVETGTVAGVAVYKFTIITYERKELVVYFTARGEEIKI